MSLVWTSDDEDTENHLETNLYMVLLLADLKDRGQKLYRKAQPHCIGYSFILWMAKPNQSWYVAQHSRQ